MGLDTVELILRTEETFAVTLPDRDCEQVCTVGDLYRLVLSKLELPYAPPDAAVLGVDRSGRQLASIQPWTPGDVWQTLRGVILDQLQVQADAVREDAEFQRDLGCD